MLAANRYSNMSSYFLILSVPNTTYIYNKCMNICIYIYIFIDTSGVGKFNFELLLRNI